MHWYFWFVQAVYLKSLRQNSLHRVLVLYIVYDTKIRHTCVNIQIYKLVIFGETCH